MSTSPEPGPDRASASVARPLPPRPSLEYERKEAKKLLRLVRSADPDSLRRVRAQWHGSESRDSSTFRLADAQRTIAREYGFASWPRLVSYFETLHRHERSPRLVQPPDFHEAQVKSVLAEHRDRRPGVGELLATFIPRFYGKSAAEALASPISADDARLAVARQGRCASWEDLMDRARNDQAERGRAREQPDTPYWRARKAIEASDLPTLATVVDEHPEIVRSSTPETTERSLVRSALIVELRRRSPAARRLTDWLVSREGGLELALNRMLCGHLRMEPGEVEHLLARGGDPNWIAPNGISVLEHALVRYWNPEALDLLARRATPRKAFWIAAGLGDAEEVARYVRRDGTLTDAARRNRPDFTAVGPGALPSLPDAADVDVMWEAFLVAGLNRRIAILELLLDCGFPIDHAPWGVSMLGFAVGNRIVPVVELLVRRGANLDVRGWRPEKSAREMAQWNYRNDPSSPDALRILELCDGGDPNEVLRE